MADCRLTIPWDHPRMQIVESLAEEIVRDPNDQRLTSRLVKYWKVLRVARPLTSRHEFRLSMMPELKGFGARQP